MHRECREYGLPEPKLIDFDGDFRVNMYRVAADMEENISTQSPTQTTQSPTQTTQTSDQAFIRSSELTEDDKAILRVIRHNPKLTQKEIALELNWTVDRVKYYLNKMKKKTMIKRIGSRHNGYWKLLIEVRL